MDLPWKYLSEDGCVCVLLDLHHAVYTELGVLLHVAVHLQEEAEAECIRQKGRP